MNFPETVATMLLAYYDCDTYGSGDYSGTCQTTTSNPATGGNSSTDNSAPVTNSQPSDNTNSSTGSSSAPSSNGNETSTQPPANNGGATVGQAIESTPYAVLIPIILGIVILLGALFILIRRIVRRS